MADAQASPDVTEIVAEHHRAVYAYAYRLAGSVQDAEDLCQQTFLVAWRKIGQVRNLECVRPWLFAILRNCFLRNRQRRRPVLAEDCAIKMDMVPSRPLGDRVDRDWLQEALNELPEIHRLVVVMFYFEECEYREIAEQLHIPIGTVMSRLARAKQHLRSLLTEAEGGKRRQSALDSSPAPEPGDGPVGAAAKRE